ncbi:patatin-like phospholipase family protein [Phaeacidiphilus oryzae]|uniref:patatin-like phospholipase family protein n=1 Tax=Phaeacidiphilus oryzae TaxID=348818 RepID=UPI000A01A461|nr:patatin-like phospholipase family protein [Phaeacidiphilus oryzae]
MTNGQNGAQEGGLALVLSGGGAPAAYFGAGVALALDRFGLRPRIYSGVSAGALNAGALASGVSPQRLRDLWQSVGWSRMFRPRYDLWRLVDPRALLRRPANPVEYLLGAVGWDWVLSVAPARETLVELLGGQAGFSVPPDRTLIVTAVDEEAGEVVRFVSRLPSKERADTGPEQPAFREVAEPDVDLLLASAAVPLLFPPGIPSGGMAGRAYTDAGLIANTPLAPALAYRPEAALVVAGAGCPRPAPAPAGLAEALALTVQNVAHYALIADYRHALTVNQLAAAAPDATPKTVVDLRLLEPADLPFSLTGFLDFAPDQAARLIEYGRAQAMELLNEWPTAQRLATP